MRPSFVLVRPYAEREHKKLEKKVKQKQEVGKEQVKAALTRALALVNAEKGECAHSSASSSSGPQRLGLRSSPDVSYRQSPRRPRARSSSSWSRSHSESSSPPAVSLFDCRAYSSIELTGGARSAAPEFYVASAISFYKALKVYPAPQELLMIYQKTQPPAVFDLVMELISLEINAAASAASSGPSSSSTEPLLQEAEGASGSSSTTAVPAAAAAAAGSENGEDSSPSSGGSFVHVETDAVVTPGGDVAAEETTAVVADIEVEQSGEATPAAASEEIDPPEPTLA